MAEEKKDEQPDLDQIEKDLQLGRLVRRYNDLLKEAAQIADELLELGVRPPTVESKAGAELVCNAFLGDEE